MTVGVCAGRMQAARRKLWVVELKEGSEGRNLLLSASLFHSPLDVLPSKCPLSPVYRSTASNAPQDCCPRIVSFIPPPPVQVADLEIVVREAASIKASISAMFRGAFGGAAGSSASTEAAAKAVASAAKAAGGSLEGARALLASGATAAAAAGGSNPFSFGRPAGSSSTTVVHDLGVVGRGRGGRVTLQPSAVASGPIPVPAAAAAAGDTPAVSAAAAAAAAKRARLEALMSGGERSGGVSGGFDVPAAALGAPGGDEGQAKRAREC